MALKSFFPLSLRWILAITTVLEVTLACFLIWWIAFKGTSSTVDDLSTSLRGTTMLFSVDQIGTLLTQPVLGCLQLYGTVGLYGSIDYMQEPNLVNTSLLSNLVNTMRTYPGISALDLYTGAGYVIGANLVSKHIVDQSAMYRVTQLQHCSAQSTRTMQTNYMSQHISAGNKYANLQCALTAPMSP